MKMRKGNLAAVLAIMGLAGCGSSDTASYLIDAPNVALTLERIERYAWSDKWEVQLIVRQFPECQRRHNLAKATINGSYKVDVYAPMPGAYILKQGKRWYVTDLKSCALQEYKEAPPEPGPLVGTFIAKDDALRFEKAPESPAPSANPAASSQPGATSGS